MKKYYRGGHATYLTRAQDRPDILSHTHVATGGGVFLGLMVLTTLYLGNCGPDHMYVPHHRETLYVVAGVTQLGTRCYGHICMDMVVIVVQAALAYNVDRQVARKTLISTIGTLWQ